MADAVDNTSLSWTTGGDANWFGQTANSHDGVDAAQSGAIGNNQSTWLTATVTGPGTLSFWWKVSSETNWDKLCYYYDGVEDDCRSGDGNWTQKSRSIDAGTHTLKWKYSKDGSTIGYSDAGWVDQVEFTSR